MWGGVNYLQIYPDFDAYGAAGKAMSGGKTCVYHYTAQSDE